MPLKIYFLIVILVCQPILAVEFKDCSNGERELLEEALKEGYTADKELIKEIQHSIKERQSEVSPQVRLQLINAQLIMGCALFRKRFLSFRCTDQKTYLMQTLPIVGNEVRVSSYELQSNDFKLISAVITHEATHKCGTTDADYFLPNKRKPRSKWHTQWQNIASTYDYWILKGFCIPNIDC